MARWETSFPEPHGDMPQGDDPGRSPNRFGIDYVCVDCDWWGVDPLHHYVLTGHAVRGRNWSAKIGNCLWTDSDAEGRRVTEVPTEVRPCGRGEHT